MPEELETTFVVEGQSAPEGGSLEGSVEAPAEPKYSVVLNGVEQELTVEELKQGYMRHADYTRKTQALSASKQELERAAQIAAALDTNPEATLRYLAQEYAVDVDAFEPEDVEDDPVTSRIRELEATIQNLSQREINRQVDAEISDLKTRYEVDDSQLEEVMAHATRTKQSLKSAYRELFFDDAIEALKALQSRRAAEAQIEEDKRGGAQAVHLGVGGAGGTPTPKVERPKTVREAYLLAKQGIRVNA
jgi:hypothetical protein